MKLTLQWNDLELHCFFLHFQCERLRELGVKCAVILDDDGKGSMDVFGHPRAVTFFEESNIAGKFYSYVNAEGTVFTIFLSINSSHLTKV